MKHLPTITTYTLAFGLLLLIYSCTPEPRSDDYDFPDQDPPAEAKPVEGWSCGLRTRPASKSGR